MPFKKRLSNKIGFTLAWTLGITYALLQSCTPTTPDANPSASAPVASPIATSSQPESPSPSPPISSPSPVAVSSPATNQPPASVATQPDTCVIRMAIVDDPNPPLNVRSSPSVTPDNVTGKLDNGTYLTVEAVQGNWLQISVPVTGWVNKDRTKSSCGEKTAQINFPANGNSATISDQLIGSGRHRYLLTATKGQTLIMTPTKGPSPTVTTPDGKMLQDNPDLPNGSPWQTQLPVSGNYALEVFSNYKGFSYSFSVQVQ
ncbi:MAG: SH3 domain-containing protein [Leptolyngbyaceae bacterium]|nr:SH3 domain-containing protein [Leptolyngbyaceae bacterium]